MAEGVGIRGRVREQSFVAGQRIAFVEATRRRRAIDPEVRVVHDFGIARTEFQSSYVPRAIHRQRDHEDPEYIRTVGL